MQGQHGGDTRAGAWRTLHLEFPAQRRDAVLESPNPVP